MEFTRDELKEIKHCINSNIGLRLQYSCILDEGKRKTDNDRWLKEDYDLLAKIVKELDMLKEELQ